MEKNASNSLTITKKAVLDNEKGKGNHNAWIYLYAPHGDTIFVFFITNDKKKRYHTHCSTNTLFSVYMHSTYRKKNARPHS